MLAYYIDFLRVFTFLKAIAREQKAIAPIQKAITIPPVGVSAAVHPFLPAIALP
jgi:hypothetical protein